MNCSVQKPFAAVASTWKEDHDRLDVFVYIFYLFIFIFLEWACSAPAGRHLCAGGGGGGNWQVCNRKLAEIIAPAYVAHSDVVRSASEESNCGRSGSLIELWVAG